MEALGVVLFALLILGSVCLHEAGHMLTAKRFGMKVTRYFVGFGPTLWSFRRGETEYGVKALPLGGFVKIVGMTPQDDDVAPADESRAMWRFPVWKRTVVMSAGSVTHFVIGFVLLWITASFIGLPNPKWETFLNSDEATLNGSKPYVQVASCLPRATTSTTCDPTAAAAKKAGLRSGDLITSMNGVAVNTYGDLVTLVRTARPDTSNPPDAKITYVRDGQTHTVTIPLATVSRPPLDAPQSDAVSTYALGVSPSLPPSEPFNIAYGPIDGISHAGTYTATTFVGIGTALKHLPGKVPGLWNALQGKPRDPNGPISVVGASELGGQTVALGEWGFFLLLAAALNFFVGVLNLFPLLPLDGGHIAIAWYEKFRAWLARRRRLPEPARVDYYKLVPITNAVIVILGAFSLLTILADIINPINIMQ
ncbi:MAG TPA: site-2 protease family protein [Micromonosporaceae bacterium]|nr:site-2 protease family protein [Micromonosporaceae bacterium]